MTHALYTAQQLQLKSIARLKQIYSEIACTAEVSDKRCKDSWVSAIAEYQASKIEKLTPAAPDNQPLTTVEINFYHHEVFCSNELIAYIAYDHDEFVTQPWLIMVNGKEKFRDTTIARCLRYIEWHHQDGTLRETFPAPLEVAEAPTILEISFYDQEAFVGDELVASISYDHGNYQNLYWRVLINNVEIFRDLSAARCHSYIKQQYQQGTLPIQEPFIEEICTISEKVTAQITADCEKLDYHLVDNDVYNNYVLLNEVGCTDGDWWFLGSSPENQQLLPCNSALDATWWLSRTDILPTAESADKYLHYRPLEQLSSDELQQLLDQEVRSQLQELVTV